MAWLTVTVIYMTLLTAGSLQPNLPAPDPYWVKELLHNAMHVPAYAFLAFLFLGNYAVRGLTPRLGWVLGLTVLIGILIEFMQGGVPGRTVSGIDILSNTGGACAAILLFRPGSSWGSRSF